MICFAVNVHIHNEHLAFRLIQQVKIYNPDQPIIVIADGFVSTLEPLCKKLGLIYIQTNVLLNTPILGGQLTEYYMKHFLELTQENILVCLDPACYIWRIFNQPVPTKDLFGSILDNKKFKYIRNGFVGYWRSAVEKIVESKLLINIEFKNNPNYIIQSIDLIPDQALIVGAIAAKLNLSLADWNELDICNRVYNPRNLNLEYAITYPHD